MHGTTTFVRRVVCQATHTPSRIPHLNVHISQRSASRVSSPKKRSHPSYQRFHSTLAHVESGRSSNRSQEESSSLPTKQGLWENEDRDASRSNGKASVSTSVQELYSEDVTNVYTILETGQPDQLLLALLNDDLGTPFLRDATDEHFDKAFLLLDPDHFIQPYQESSRRLFYFDSDDQQDFRSISGIYERGKEYLKKINKIVDIRRKAGRQLTLQACQHLLKWAAILGVESVAHNVLQIIMLQDRVQPDIDCYNYYLRAIVWNHGHSLMEKFNLRVTRRNLDIRATRTAPKSLSGHKVANPALKISGIRADVLKLFKQLIEKELIANEATFINLMIAMGREGDMPGVQSVLKSVWNIDLDMLREYDEDEIESPTFYELDSPLRPSTDLLFAVAHIFTINNDAHAAWTLVDFISRNYDLQIPRFVWHHLLEWFMVLAIKRTPSETKKGQGDGRLDPTAFEELYAVMVDKPHDIEPDAHMLYLRARNIRTQRLLDEEIAAIKRLADTVENQRLKSDLSIKAIEVYFEKHRRSHINDLWGRQAFFNIRRNFFKESYDFEVQYQLLQRAIFNLFLFDKWAGTDDWQRRRLPEAMAQFAQYLPDMLVYKIDTGEVEIMCSELKAHAQTTQTGSQLRNMRYIRKMLDVDNHEILLRRVRLMRRDLPCQLCDSLNHYTPTCPHDTPQLSTLANFGKSVPEVAAAHYSQ